MDLDPRGKINSIPIVGVLLVPLIICFIVTPRWPDHGKAPAVALPVSTAHRHSVMEPYRPIQFTITRDGGYWLEDGSELAPAGVAGVVRSHSHEGVYLLADKEVPYGAIRKLLRGVSHGGATGVALAVTVIPDFGSRK